MKKRILIIAAIVVVALGAVLGVVAANLGRIVNARKGELLARAQAVSGREISVGEVGVAWWPGIGVRVSDVVVGEDSAYAAEPFVRATELRVNVKLLPLFRKKVDIKRFVLREPQITVIKGQDGRFNFTSLVERMAPPAPGGPGVAPRKHAGAKRTTGAAAVIAFADVEKGTLRFVDRARGLDYTVREIDLKARDVRLDAPAHVTLAAAVFGSEAQDVRVEASVGPIGVATPENLAQAPVSAQLELSRVSFADLARLSPKRGTAPPPAGDVAGSASLSGTLGAATLDELHAAITVLGATEPNVELTASGGPFNLLADSTRVFADARLKGTFRAGPMSLAEVKLKPKTPGTPAPKLGGDVTASGSFDGAFAAVAFTGDIDATAASFSQPPQLEKAAGIPAKAAIKGTFHPARTPQEGVDLSSIDIVFHTLKATGSGRFVPFKGRESYDMTFKAHGPIAPLKELMPSLAAFAPTGDADATIRIRGVPKPGAAPDVSGTASLDGVGATLPQVPEKLHDGKGAIAFTAKTAQVSGATFAIGKSQFRLDAEATALKPLAATYEVTSLEVWRADVQAAPPGAPPPPRPEVFRNLLARGRMVEKAPKVIDNQLDLASKSGVFSNIDYSDFTASLRVTPETTFIDRFVAKAMGGTVSGKGRFEPKASKFDVTSKLEQVNLAEYFRYKAPALADVVVGTIDADVRLSGAGKTWEEVQKTLAGEGVALVVEGAFLNVNVMKEIVAGIQRIPLVPPSFSQGIQAKNPSLFKENKTAFQKLDGKLKIADGKIQAPSLKLVTDDFAIAGAGWFSFGKEMDINSTLTLSEKMTNDIVAQFPMAKYLATPQGRLEAPLSLKGAIAKPAVGVDVAALTARAQQSFMQNAAPREKVKEGVKEGVKDLLGGFGKQKEAPKAPADTSRARPR